MLLAFTFFLQVPHIGIQESALHVRRWSSKSAPEAEAGQRWRTVERQNVERRRDVE